MNGITNPIVTKDVNSPNSVFRGMLYHTRKSNYTKQSIFKIKESEYRIHLFTAFEIQTMYSVLPTMRDKLIFKFLIQSGARISGALALKIEDVPIPDFSCEISVLHHVKSKGGYRDIYIPTGLLAELATILWNTVHLSRRRIAMFLPRSTRISKNRETFECRNCRKDGQPYMEKSLMPYPVIQHSMASLSTVAWVMHQKFVNALPLYRQEKEWRTLGVNLSRATMSNWIMAASRDWLSPNTGADAPETFAREIYPFR